MPVKKLPHRAKPENSQALRRSFQLAFLALNLWIGAQFLLFVKFYESGMTAMRVGRPAGVEGWLPIASLMNLKVLLAGGGMPTIHPAGTVLLVAFLLCSLLFRKSFCGWLCPVGTVSEYLWRLGRRIFGRTFRLHRLVDVPLRGLKYLLLAFFLYAVVAMPVEGIHEFLESPYGMVDDVKMLNFVRHLGGDGRRGADPAGVAVAGGAEFLVPVFMSLRSADGPDGAAESVAHPAGGGGLY